MNASIATRKSNTVKTSNAYDYQDSASSSNNEEQFNYPVESDIKKSIQIEDLEQSETSHNEISFQLEENKQMKSRKQKYR